MARPKGTKNKVSVTLPEVCNLSSSERIELLANLMIDRILDDQSHGQKLYRNLKRQGYAKLP